MHIKLCVFDVFLQQPRLANVTCERVFKGILYKKPVVLAFETVRPDYALVPKHEEHKYKPLTTEEQVREKNIYPSHTEYPPMLRKMLMESGVADPKLRLAIPEEKVLPNLYRVAKDGERPTLDFPTGFGTAINKKHIASVNYDI